MKTVVFVGLLLLTAAQASAQFVCLNDRGEWTLDSGACARFDLPVYSEPTAPPVEMESTKLKVRLAELEARIRVLEIAHDALFSRQVETSMSQVEINDRLMRTLETIRRRLTSE